MSPVCHRHKYYMESLLLLLFAILGGPHPVTLEKLSISIDDIEETVDAISNIIGGEIAEPGSTPWLISLKDIRYHQPVHFCAGTILNNQWILTAAHCIHGYDEPSRDVEVVVGEYNLADFDFFWEKTKKILLVFIHPDYNYFTRDFNVALIQVASEINFNMRVSPLPLPPLHRKKLTSGSSERESTLETDGASDADNISSDSEGFRDSCASGKMPSPIPIGKKKKELGYIAGWGSTEEMVAAVSLVHEAYVPIVRKEACYFIYPGLFTEAMICAGNLTSGGVDPCNGDWGGPMVDPHGYLGGVASWSIGCGRPGFPAVYVDITYVQDWICDVLGGDGYHHPSSDSKEEEYWEDDAI